MPSLARLLGAVCALLLSASAISPLSAAREAAKKSQPQAPAGPPQPPHAWLFGTWTGGIFPAAPKVSAQACLSQPVVIFTRDVVLRATLTSELYTQRVIESARTGRGGAEFRFSRAASPVADPFGLAGPAGEPGFGCADGSDVLQVERHSADEIAFPRCADFPYPLVRCPSR